jgi:predicted RNA-binding Zn ribbon-like protein
VTDRPLTGEPLPLDLVDTQWRTGEGLHDLFDDDDAMTAWLHGHGLHAPGLAPSAVRAPLIAARAAIRQALDGTDGQWRGLDQVLGHGRIRLRAAKGGVGAEPEVDDPAWMPAWECARALGDLLASHGHRIRACEGQGCVLWFADTSRNATRRWCSMAACGNRAKARAHYRRAQEGDAAGSGPRVPSRAQRTTTSSRNG